MTTPNLAIRGLHVRNLRGLKAVDWPEDGIGWEAVPDRVLIGGENGSGKTTLLEFLAAAAAFISLENHDGTRSFPAEEAEVHFAIGASSSVRSAWIVVGTPPYIAAREALPDRRCVSRHDRRGGGQHRLYVDKLSPDEPASTPRILFVPSRRELATPATEHKSAGMRRRSSAHVQRLAPATQWVESTEALLWEARWRDLNAMADGHPEQMTHFGDLARVFVRITDGRRRLEWIDGDLFVVTDDGARHDLDALSDGEKQILHLTAELADRWTPGALVLIDEIEAHLHPVWQFALWEALGELRAARGGQIIATTQSNYLFGLVDPLSTVILGRSP